MRHYRITLDMGLDPNTSGAVGPIGWDWHDLLDMSTDETVSIVEVIDLDHEETL